MLWMGGTTPGPVSNYSQWSATVPHNPAPIEVDLHSLCDLFYFSPSLQTNCELGRINYLDRQALINQVEPSLTMMLNILLLVKPIGGKCAVPSLCSTYPSYPSCAVYYCPGTCPNSNTYCGSDIPSCCSFTSPSSYNSIVDIVVDNTNKLIDDIKQLQIEITNALSSPIIDHTTTVDIWNQYVEIMSAVATVPRTLECTGYYNYEPFPCLKWSSMNSTSCHSSSTDNKGYACPNPSQQLPVYGELTYPVGVQYYNGTLVEDIEVINYKKTCKLFKDTNGTTIFDII